MSNTQLILLAHGSRDSRWCRTFEQGLKAINARLDHQASLAYMEMATPTLAEVVETFYAQGTRNFRIVPLFFAAGRHLLHDVPAQLEALEQQWPGVRLILHEAVGEQPGFWSFLGELIAGDAELNPILQDE